MKQIHDITPPRKGIHDIRRSGFRRPPRRVESVGDEETRPVRFPRSRRLFRSRSTDRPLSGQRRLIPRRSTLIILFAVLGLFLLAGSFLFAGSRISVIPKQESAFVDAVLEAFREASPGALAFRVVTLEQVGSLVVPATKTQHVEERATGRIVIFNNYDGARQRLITNTRFETPDGLIYRINEPVIVPGRIERDGEIIPGSIEVSVYAESPGAHYNIGLSDFTIPGFEGSPRFEGFFARSKTAMTGGFVGEKRVVDPDTLRETRELIEASLRSELTAQAKSEAPTDALLYEDGLFFGFEALPETEEGNDVEVSVRGTVAGVFFDTREFAAYIAERTLAGYDGAPVIIENPQELSFAVSDKEAVLPTEDESLTFSLTGTARIVWTFDENTLRSDLSGRSKDALPTILGGYPGIVRAEIVLSPFWRSTFPDDPAEIEVRTILDE